jgi:hypothetical protein
LNTLHRKEKIQKIPLFSYCQAAMHRKFISRL